MDDNVNEVVEKKSHKFLNFLIFIFLIIIFLFIYSKYIGTKGLIVKEYKVTSNILTSNFSGLKVVHFSDLLYKSTVDKNDVKKLVNKIIILRPDLVVFTGNLVSKNVKISESDTDFLIEELSKINSVIGKYAIYGTNDFAYEDYVKVMNNSDFKILNNEYEELFYKTNESIYLVGLPSSIKQTIDLDNAFKFYSDEDRRFIILLTHEGKTIKYIDESSYEIDLILSGHSLNGSIVLPFYGGIIKDENSYKYSKPFYQKGITNIYVSSGIGSDFGYRFLNKPSFNLYRLKAQS